MDADGQPLSDPADIVQAIVDNAAVDPSDAHLHSPHVDDLASATGAGSQVNLPPGSSIEFTDMDNEASTELTLVSYVQLEQSSATPQTVEEFVTSYGDPPTTGLIELIAQEGNLILYVDNDYVNPTEAISVDDYNGQMIQTAISVDTTVRANAHTRAARISSSVPLRRRSRGATDCTMP